MFDRFQVCLGYYHFAGQFNGTEEAYIVWQRLRALDYQPSISEEYFDILDDPNYELAAEVYDRLKLLHG